LREVEKYRWKPVQEQWSNLYRELAREAALGKHSDIPAQPVTD
jgi:hypothetical protein